MAFLAWKSYMVQQLSLNARLSAALICILIRYRAADRHGRAGLAIVTHTTSAMCKQVI